MKSEKQYTNGLSKTSVTDGTKKRVKLPSTPLQKLIALHQWPCLFFIGSIFLMGQIDPSYKKFYQLQYRNEQTGLYMKGSEDIYFVIFWIIGLIFFRWLIQSTFLTGLAWLMGVKGSTKLTKFKEAGYFGIWHFGIWSWGLSTILPLGWLFDIRHHWIGYPHLVFGWDYKLYYLIQCAFWISCVFILLIEKKRKDFFQMITHHFVTISLTSFSYYMNFTRIGIATLIEQDTADWLLYLSKILNYARWEMMCNICFVVFSIVWIVTRHGLYFIVVYSIYMASDSIKFGWDPSNDYYFNAIMRNTYLVGFIILQLLLIFWTYLLLKVLYKVISSIGPSDIRSDDEDEEHELVDNDLKKDDKKKQ